MVLRFSCSKRNDTDPRTRFDLLPDDVLIIIISQLDVHALLSLRLTNRKICSVIYNYFNTIAPAVARQTFPDARRLLNPPDGKYTIQWLRELIPKQLAAVLVDRHRFAHGWAENRYGIPAEDPFGAELRIRVANGWRVLQKLSTISQDVHRMKIAQLAFSKKELSLAVFNPPRFKLLVEEHRENMILERRLTYIASLPDKLAMDYKLMFLLLSSVFRMSLESTLDNDYKPWIFDLGFGIDGPGLLRKGNSWMTWYILHEGPSMFWEQWWLQPRDDPGTQSWVCDRSIAAWLRDTTSSVKDFNPDCPPDDWVDVNERKHSLQRKVAHKIQETIEARAGTFSESDSNPIPYFTRYAEHRRSRIANGEPDPDETMDQVPFHVDFRCPEKPKGRFCFSKQRDISIVRSD